jgi:hypothetical protein
MRDRKLQRALLQFFKPENYFEVREALLQTGRKNLIGGCDGLIAAEPPREALEARRKRANKDFNDHVHSDEMPKGVGYRPGRTTAKRRVQ